MFFLSFGTSQISVSKYVGSICELLGDANAQVRSVATESLVEIYRHVGVKVRIDITKRTNIPPAKLNLILQKFDELDKESGEDGDEVNYKLITFDLIIIIIDSFSPFNSVYYPTCTCTHVIHV